MTRGLYTLLFYLLLPLVLLRLLYRASKAPGYAQRVAERFGVVALPAKCQGSIWVHAVSVGETIAAAPLVEALLAAYPDKTVLLTTMTPTGSKRVQALFMDGRNPIDGLKEQRVFHVYAPYDLPGSIGRLLNTVKPCSLIIMETELWPNTIHYCHRAGVPVIVANARLSARWARLWSGAALNQKHAK